MEWLLHDDVPDLHPNLNQPKNLAEQMDSRHKGIFLPAKLYSNRFLVLFLVFPKYELRWLSMNRIGPDSNCVKQNQLLSFAVLSWLNQNLGIGFKGENVKVLYATENPLMGVGAYELDAEKSEFRSSDLQYSSKTQSNFVLSSKLFEQKRNKL